MNEEIKQSLEQYLHNANFDLTHPSDMERFYEFIITSYQKGEKVDMDIFERMVKEKAPSIDDEWLKKKFSLYENGIELLTKYNQ
ncbi:MAG: hypothetical protein WC727_08860 [Ignavibacteriaceae bacterium]|jgi:hypothetical protein